MSIRLPHSPRIIALFSAFVLIASLLLPFASAQAALGDKCDNAYIMHCGYTTKADWQKTYQNGDGTNSAANLHQIYSSQGVTPADMASNSTVEGFVTRDSKVIVGGKVVATNVWSTGRSSLGFNNAVNMGNGVWFHPTGVTFASGVQQIPALVSMKGGTFQFAVMKSCGNIVKTMNKPFGLITKQVQDKTTNSALVAADDAAHALASNNGDIVEYRVSVGNNGTGDMTNVVFRDDLPAGLTLVSNASMRHLEDNLGTIPAGGVKVISITAKVTATSNGQTIDNQACFTAGGGQKGCDHAVIKVNVVQPAPVPTPVTEVSFRCVNLSATVMDNNTVHFVAQADAPGTAIQEYQITLNTGEQINVISGATSVVADRQLAPGTYTAVLRVRTSAGTTEDISACHISFTVGQTGGGTVPEIPVTTVVETPQTGPESALGGLLGIGGLGYAARGYLRSRRGLVDSIKRK